MKRLIILFGILMLSALLLAETAFERDITAAKGAKAQENVIQRYLPNASTLEEHRQIQAAWHELKPKAMQDYYDALAAKEPHNPDYQYLSLRYIAPEKAFPRLRPLLAKQDVFYWNARLYALNISESYLAKKLEQVSLSEDEALLRKCLKAFPEDSYLKIALFYLYLAQGNSAMAGRYLAEVDAAGVLAANWQAIEEYLLTEKNLSLFDALSGILFMDEVFSGNIEMDALDYFQSLARDEFLEKLAQRESQDPGSLK